ncbi:MAG TPA: MOSC N-terminal beta barrel domain-containing protein [Candidatus Melainabacteria bacterium]|nr:MOSC N-terminal beta barrel domain-containing protein [Candidatus Melainabacteria bacterium]
MKTVRIVELNRYPVKSLGGISLSAASIEEKGIQFDRNWLVTLPSGKFLTQREIPKMALVRTAVSENGDLTLSAEGHADIQVPRASHSPDADFKRVTVWKDECYAIDEGDKVAAWLSDVLETKCRLVKMKDGFKRPIIDEGKEFEGSVRFQDQYPLLVISTASLAALNEKLEKPLPMNRFRPNIVIEGCEPFEEDQFKTLISSSGVALASAKPCARCVVTTTDQSTAERGVEPLRTLATFRTSEQGVLFGQNLTVTSRGNLQVGEHLEAR